MPSQLLESALVALFVCAVVSSTNFILTQVVQKFFFEIICTFNLLKVFCFFQIGYFKSKSLNWQSKQIILFKCFNMYPF